MLFKKIIIIIEIIIILLTITLDIYKLYWPSTIGNIINIDVITSSFSFFTPEGHYQEGNYKLNKITSDKYILTYSYIINNTNYISNKVNIM